jgi:predicted nucleotidyltransferase
VSATEQLRALADRVVGVYERHVSPAAVLLAGSAARGDADFYSDLDLLLYYETLPPRASFEAALAELGGTLLRSGSDTEDSGFDQIFELDGVQCQLGHAKIAWFEGELEQIVAGERLDTPYAKVVMGLLQGMPLRGEELIARWREQCRYRDQYQRAVLERHWKIFPLWAYEGYLRGRDASLWRQQLMLQGAFDLLAVLAALNRVYFTDFEVKRTREFVATLELAPPNLLERLERLLLPGTPATELESLVAETQALLAEHLPEVELPPLRRAVGERLEPWRNG